MNFKNALSNRYYQALAVVTMWSCSALEVVAQTTNPAAPLDFLQSARSAAASSTINSAGILSLSNTTAYVIAAVMGVIGLGAFSISGHAAYKGLNDEQSRVSVGKSVMAAIAGALLTISGIIVAVVTNFVTN